MAPTPADIYLRLSEDRTGLQAGVQRQELECRDLCERLGHPVGRVYMDNDLSATTGVRRPAFEQLLSDRPPLIVVWHTDRLIRVTRDLERVIELGVNVHAVTAGHLDLSTPAGRAVARTVTAWATYEGEQKSMRQKAASRQRAREGRAWWPSRPFGYEMDGSLREEEALALRTAYASLLAGVPLSRVATELNEAGMVTNRGNEWTAMTFRPVLLNARNAAVRVYNGEEIGAAAWDAVVPEETWRATVRLLAAPGRRTGGGGRRTTLLTGFATCGKCQSEVKAAHRGRSGQPGSYQVYTCRRSSCVSHRVDFVDTVVGAKVVAFLSRPGASGLVLAGSTEDVGKVREEVVALRERLDALADDYADGILTRSQLQTGSERIRTRLTEAEEMLTHLGAGTALQGLPEASQVVSWWQGLSMDRQRAAIETLVERVDLLPRGRGARALRDTDLRVVWRTTKAPTSEEAGARLSVEDGTQADDLLVR